MVAERLTFVVTFSRRPLRTDPAEDACSSSLENPLSPLGDNSQVVEQGPKFRVVRDVGFDLGQLGIELIHAAAELGLSLVARKTFEPRFERCPFGFHPGDPRLVILVAL